MAQDLVDFYARKKTPTSLDADVQKTTATQLSVSDDPFERYKLFSAMYDSNNLYQDIRRSAYRQGTWLENIFSIANSSHRSVEFYANRLLMNARVSTKNTALGEAINKFWQDSNFLGIKDNLSREVAKKGDLFLKLETSSNLEGKVEKVFISRLEVHQVTSVQADSRGVVTEIRIDVPIEDNMTWTEYWTVEGGGYTSVWKHQYGREADLEQLGDPIFTKTLAYYGITFIPIVWIKFTSGEKRAENCFVHAISKIIEGDREHSRLAEIMYAFNNAIWSLTSSALTDKGQVVGKVDVKFIKSADGQVIQYIKNGGELKPNIPQLDYQAHINLIKITKDELMQDLPETKLNSLDPTQATGRAIEQMLGESVNRAKTARFNLIQGIRRLNMMAVTVGQFYGFFDKSIGTYEEGNFMHEIVCDSVIPLSPTDKALMLQQFVSGGMAFKSALRQCEYSESEIEQMMADKAEEEARLANSFLNNPSFMRDTNKIGG